MIDYYSMLTKGDRVLVAVSGGPDSVCLLKALVELRKVLGITLVVGNMDHSLRGKASRNDSNFVKTLSKEWEIECVYKKINVKLNREKGLSLEEYARKKRYAFLIEAARRKKCNVIATGHTMDDQAETVLMRIVHGASLAGISGIPPVRYEANAKIIRPLIRLERREILSFLKTCALKYKLDKTNLDTKFLRNKIRHKLLPLLEKYNPRIKRTLVNLADIFRESVYFIEKAKENFFLNSSLDKNCKSNAVNIKEIMLQPNILQREILKELFTSSGGNRKKLTHRHWMDMDYFLRVAKPNKVLDLPGKVRLTKGRHNLAFTKTS